MIYLILLAAALLSGFGVAVLYLPAAINHALVAVALLLVSAIVSFLATQLTTSWASVVHEVGNDLPSPIREVLLAVRPLSNVGILTLLDVLCVAIMFFAAYCVTVVLRRLIETVRILKVSRRRLTQAQQQSAN